MDYSLFVQHYLSYIQEFLLYFPLILTFFNKELITIMKGQNKQHE